MRFALVGAAGYVAPRHLEAIRDLGHEVVAVADPHDSVGVLDRYFPAAAYYPDLESLIDDLRAGRGALDFVSICSPNDLHEHHIRLSLEAGAHAICEKPLVLDPAGLDRLERVEHASGRRVFGVLQLRHHERLLELRRRLLDPSNHSAEPHHVVMTYVTPRGAWYRDSWKGDPSRSGGLAANIGVHLFDLLLWLFGGFRCSTLHSRSDVRMGGRLELQRARVDWQLSIDGTDLPDSQSPDQPFRSLRIDDTEVPFDAPPDLHRAVYRSVLDGVGLGIREVRAAVELVHRLQRDPIEEDPGSRSQLADSGYAAVDSSVLHGATKAPLQ